ncbi:serine hydrolase domain-containing protein [Streptomyces sp. NPDC049881]|uniref:serine hydrolase domain-containing protein n=1 Tax=Streptomyces sp. NPDC049881 TaxID=3155778 RepID=UPI0034212CD3
MDAQARAEELLHAYVASGRETGLQVAAWLDGALVVDAWAGTADPATGRAVDGDTLFQLYSCGKGLTATAIHLLADRGVLDYDAPIAAYWPEFGVHGKDRITVRHALTHRAGIPHLPDDFTLGDMADWDRACAVVADMTPVGEPGTRSGYHPVVFGWLLGETIRRADGRRPDRFVREEITGPLGIDGSLDFGIPGEALPRVAHHREADDTGAVPARHAPADTPLRTLSSAAQANHPLRLGACVPSSAVGTARGLARLYAALARGGELDGVRLLSPDRIATATATAVHGIDATLGKPMRRGLGYVLGRPGTPMGHARVFGHDGVGESIGFADPAHRFSLAVAKNRLTDDWTPASTTYALAAAIREALGLPLPGA